MKKGNLVNPFKDRYPKYLSFSMTVLLLTLTFFLSMIIALQSQNIRQESEKLEQKIRKRQDTQDVKNIRSWKTYTNQEFSFRYPSTWLDAETNALSTRTSVTVNDGKEGDYLISRLEITSGSYYKQEPQREIATDELIENQGFSTGEDVTSAETELGDYKGYRYTYHGHGVGHYITSIFLAKPETPTDILLIVYRDMMLRNINQKCQNNSNKSSPLSNSLTQKTSMINFAEGLQTFNAPKDTLVS